MAIQSIPALSSPLLLLMELFSDQERQSTTMPQVFESLQHFQADPKILQKGEDHVIIFDIGLIRLFCPS